MYIDEAKRSLPLNYTGQVWHKGIEMRRYEVYDPVLVADAGVLRGAYNMYKNEEKYMQDPRRVPDGFYSIERAKAGVPVVLSRPRHNWAQVADVDGVTCSSPEGPLPCPLTYDPAVHNTVVDVEPTTGLTMNGAKRLQANMRVSAMEWFQGPAACPNANPSDACNPTCTATQPADGSYAPYFQSPAARSVKPGGFNGHYNNLFKTLAEGAPASSTQYHETLYLPWYWADLHDIVKDDDAQDMRDSKKDIDNGRQLGDDLQIAGTTVGSVGFVASGAAIIWLALH